MFLSILSMEVTEESVKTFAENLKNLKWNRFLPAILIVVIGFIIAKIILRLLQKGLNRADKIDRSLHAFIITGARILIYTLIILTALSEIGVNVSGFLVIIGTAALAVSLAMQGVLSNVVGGLMVLITRPFKVDDLVSVEGAFGYVEQIGFNYTVIRTADKRRCYIPNKKVSEVTLINLSQDGVSRLDMLVEMPLKYLEEEVIAIMKEAADIPLVLKTPETGVLVTAYNQQSITYQIRMYVNTVDYAKANLEVIRRMRDIFTEHKMEFVLQRVQTNEM